MKCKNTPYMKYILEELGSVNLNYLKRYLKDSNINLIDCEDLFPVLFWIISNDKMYSEPEEFYTLRDVIIKLFKKHPGIYWMGFRYITRNKVMVSRKYPEIYKEGIHLITCKVFDWDPPK